MLRTTMTDPYLEHPTEEALERFLLNQSEEQELDVLETHILACDSCVTRLERLELEVATMKAALTTYETERIQKELAPVKASWKDWFTVPHMSWAGAAAAAVALGLVVVPHSVPRVVDLSATRGGVVATLPEGRPLELHLDAGDIPAGTLNVQLVNGAGQEVWKGQTSVSNEKASVRLPELSQTGAYFLRFYSPAAGSSQDLLREFRFEVK